MAWKRFMAEWDSEVPVYLLQVIEDREVSDEVERITGIRHESPQALLFHRSKVIFHTSHSAINAAEIKKLITSEPR
jgi:bacillithiol system protein YtxJ